MKSFIMNVTLSCVLLFIGFFHSIAGAHDSCHGIWIDDLYVHILKSSLSPKAAFTAADIPILQIDVQKQVIAFIHHFHEMSQYTIEDMNAQSGEIVLSNRHDAVQSITCSDDRLNVSYIADDERTVAAKFSRISSDVNNIHQNVSRYIAQLILAGEYQDAENRTYIFTPNEATWERTSFRYMIFLDYVEFTPIDVLCEIDEKGLCQSTFGFVTDGGILQIYEYDDEVKKIGKLLLDLRKK